MDSEPRRAEVLQTVLTDPRLACMRFADAFVSSFLRQETYTETLLCPV